MKTNRFKFALAHTLTLSKKKRGIKLGMEYIAVARCLCVYRFINIKTNKLIESTTFFLLLLFCVTVLLCSLSPRLLFFFFVSHMQKTSPTEIIRLQRHRNDERSTFFFSLFVCVCVWLVLILISFARRRWKKVVTTVVGPSSWSSLLLNRRLYLFKKRKREM
jgi:hypothetical protein